MQKETIFMTVKYLEEYQKFCDDETIQNLILFWKLESNRLEKLVSKGVPQPVFACGHCVDCQHYEKIDDTEVQHEETFWERCNHKNINEMLIWDCEKIGCTEFEKRASKSC